MRRRPTNNNGGGYNNQHKRPQRYQQGGGDNRSGGQNNYRGNGPRRNYPQLREKYLAQARDALAAGDRVQAESYFQHAEHCYRMMVEEGSHRPQPAPAAQQPQENGVQQQTQSEEFIPENTNQLPQFLTANYEQSGENKPVDPATVQNWEDRDA